MSAHADEHRREEILWPRVGATVFACVLILGAAGGVFAALKASKKKPPRKEQTATKVGVIVHEVGARAIEPVVAGFGRTRASRRVDVSTIVGGPVASTHADLEDGAILPAGAEAVVIDSHDLDREVERLVAQRDAAAAEQMRLEAQRDPLAARLEAARRLHALETEQVDRIQRLFKIGEEPQRDLDLARVAAVRQEEAIAALESTEAQLGPQILAAAARLAEVESALALARKNRARATIVSPFRGQLAGVDVEAGELLAPRQRLFSLWAIDAVELPIPLPIDEASLLGTPLLGTAPPPAGTGDEAPVVAVETVGGAVTSRTGRLVRFEPVDPDSQTIRAIVRIENRPGEAPLLPGLFCRARFQAPPLDARLVIPAEALQERSRVYACREGRLVVLDVRVVRRVGEWLVVEPAPAADDDAPPGLHPGDRLIVSPLEKVAAGLALEVVAVRGADGAEERR